ncbi:discoidin domain-containing protein [Cerasicoccus frondis]|uniref:discoidin domain-containing protein n=1 Tax=Cerasicoccus frondis TaxID=490090 RepID=UPI002852A216|nr:discoidin domain-containing protein [Cerasicoccus frondis]
MIYFKFYIRLLGVVVAMFITVGLSANTLPNLVIPNTFCIQTKDGDMSSANRNLIEATGTPYVRKGFIWGTIEKSQGIYDFSYYDDFVDDMRAKGIGILVTMAFNNSLYENHGERAILTAQGRQGFANFAAALADRYKDDDVIFEIWNEPNLGGFWGSDSNTDEIADQYTELVAATVPVMRAADPDCLIFAGSVSSLGTGSFGWIERCLIQGIHTTGIDGISVHPYGFPWPELAYKSGYVQLQNLLDVYGAGNLAIINSETGFSDVYLISRGVPAADAEYWQSCMLVRQYLIDLMADVRLTNWYQWKGSKWGMVNDDLSLRASYYAAQTMLATLSGYHFVERVEVESHLDYVIILENDFGDQKLIAWTAPTLSDPSSNRLPTQHAISLDTQSTGMLDVHDVYGNAWTVNVVNGQISLNLAEDPVFVTLNGPITHPILGPGHNFALTAATTVSSGIDKGAKLTDGNTSSNSNRWLGSESTYPQWAVVDFKQQRDITELRYLQHTERVDDYEIQAWDGSAWVTVVSGIGNTDLDIIETFPAVTTDKIRFYITAGSSTQKVYEMEVYGQSTSSVPVTPVNVALGKVATASSTNGGSLPSRAIDGDTSSSGSRWMSSSSEAYPQWIEVDLGSDYDITEINYIQSTQRVDDYEIQVWNGSSWLPVATGVANTDLTINEQFSSVTTSKVRFLVSSGTYYQKVYEFEVLGTPSI